jgi:hypothetical protein
MPSHQILERLLHLLQVKAVLFIHYRLQLPILYERV